MIAKILLKDKSEIALKFQIVYCLICLLQNSQGYIMQPVCSDVESGPLLLHVQHPVATSIGAYNGREIENLNHLINQYRQTDNTCTRLHVKIATIAGVLALISTALMITGFVLLCSNWDHYNFSKKKIELLLFFSGTIGVGLFYPLTCLIYKKCE